MDSTLPDSASRILTADETRVVHEAVDAAFLEHNRRLAQNTGRAQQSDETTGISRQPGARPGPLTANISINVTWPPADHESPAQNDNGQKAQEIDGASVPGGQDNGQEMESPPPENCTPPPARISRSNSLEREQRREDQSQERHAVPPSRSSRDATGPSQFRLNRAPFASNQTRPTSQAHSAAWDRPASNHASNNRPAFQGPPAQGVQASSESIRRPLAQPAPAGQAYAVPSTVPFAPHMAYYQHNTGQMFFGGAAAHYTSHPAAGGHPYWHFPAYVTVTPTGQGGQTAPVPSAMPYNIPAVFLATPFVSATATPQAPAQGAADHSAAPAAPQQQPPASQQAPDPIQTTQVLGQSTPASTAHSETPAQADQTASPVDPSNSQPIAPPEGISGSFDRSPRPYPQPTAAPDRTPQPYTRAYHHSRPTSGQAANQTSAQSPPAAQGSRQVPKATQSGGRKRGTSAPSKQRTFVTPTHQHICSVCHQVCSPLHAHEGVRVNKTWDNVTLPSAQPKATALPTPPRTPEPPNDDDVVDGNDPDAPGVQAAAPSRTAPRRASYRPPTPPADGGHDGSSSANLRLWKNMRYELNEAGGGPRWEPLPGLYAAVNDSYRLFGVANHEDLGDLVQILSDLVRFATRMRDPRYTTPAVLFRQNEWPNEYLLAYAEWTRGYDSTSTAFGAHDYDWLRWHEDQLQHVVNHCMKEFARARPTPAPYQYVPVANPAIGVTRSSRPGHPVRQVFRCMGKTLGCVGRRYVDFARDLSGYRMRQY